MAKQTKASDVRAHYTLALDSDEAILAAAEQILLRKMGHGQLLTDPASAGEVFRMRLANHEREVFSVAFLDTRHRIIAIEDLFFGGIDGAEIHPRVVARSALKHNAAAVICAHNHPSTDTEPSAADRAVTARLKQALALLDIRLLDHFVVGGNERPVSLASRGWV